MLPHAGSEFFLEEFAQIGKYRVLFARLNNNRWLLKGNDLLPTIGENLIYLAVSRLMLWRTLPPDKMSSKTRF